MAGSHRKTKFVRARICTHSLKWRYPLRHHQNITSSFLLYQIKYNTINQIYPDYNMLDMQRITDINRWLFLYTSLENDTILKFYGFLNLQYFEELGCYVVPI